MPMKPMPTMPMRIIVFLLAPRFHALRGERRFRTLRVSKGNFGPYMPYRDAGRPGSAFPTRSVGTRTSMLVMACRLGFNRAADNIDSSGELMMNRGRFLVLLGIVCFAIGLGHWIQDGRAQQASAVQWIWFDEGDPTQSAPAETRYF